jgi:hypothetical protein
VIRRSDAETKRSDVCGKSPERGPVWKQDRKVIEAKCAGPGRRDAGARLQLHQRTFVVGSEHCAVAIDDERSQTDDLLVVCDGARQVTDEQTHHAYMGLVRKAVGRRLDSVGHLRAPVGVEHGIGSFPT